MIFTRVVLSVFLFCDWMFGCFGASPCTCRCEVVGDLGSDSHVVPIPDSTAAISFGLLVLLCAFFRKV